MPDGGLMWFLAGLGIGLFLGAMGLSLYYATRYDFDPDEERRES